MLQSPLVSHSVRVLLVQARSAPTMVRQEQQCFLERCRITPEQLVTLNCPYDALPDAPLSEVDALMIGGAGEYSAADDYPWMDDLLDLTQEAVQRSLPTFGSCWGHQIIARALGGEVIHDSARAELGCREVELTEAGASDPLFHRFPPRFKANMGHHDRVATLPPGAVELARNEQPNQAYRLRDAPVYGTQFHSELDAAREKERLFEYREYYEQDLPSGTSVEDVAANLAQTTEVDHLLYDFLTTFTIPAGSTTLDDVPPR